MFRRSRLLYCTVLILLAIGLLQLANHFMLFDGGQDFVRCVCSDSTQKRRETKALMVERSMPAALTKPDIFDSHIDGLLTVLKEMNIDERDALGVDVEQLNKILAQVSEMRKGKQTTMRTTLSEATAQGAEVQEICPEKFLGKSLDYGYPFFRKGFATLNCTQHVPVADLITVVFDDVYMNKTEPASSEKVLTGLAKEYPKIRVVYITRNRLPSNRRLKSNVELVVVDKPVKQGKMWSLALAKVTTKYILIAPNMDTFDDDIKLDRLIRALSHNPEFAMAAGAYRTRNGHWDIGCQQALVRNYTLTFQGGYYLSHGECVLCDYTPAPWVARTKELKEMQFDENLDFGTFHDIFWKIKKRGKIAVSCPDIMFNIAKPKDDNDGRYVNFVKKYDLRRIIETNGRVRWYGCKRDSKHKTSNACSKSRGLAVPPCDLENLADAIKMIMRECEKAGLFCELQEGSLLGAVKFNKVLPWERDADLTFHTANYSAFKALAPIFRDVGYSFSSYDNSIWCCVDNRQAGGKFRMSADGWNIELYGQHLMESEILAARGEAPTKVDFAGQMVTVMRNPGLFARNRYGERIYMHQEHWLSRGKNSGWLFYNPGKFEKCVKAGHSGCLSQYSIDGNMQFDRNICPCSLEALRVA